MTNLNVDSSDQVGHFYNQNKIIDINTITSCTLGKNRLGFHIQNFQNIDWRHATHD